VSALNGQSVFQIDGLHLNEPHFLLQETKPPCGCDAPVRGVWTFAGLLRISDTLCQTYCRKCGLLGEFWDPSTC
jgi:hypothetical protein